jgi:hypothetical protein
MDRIKLDFLKRYFTGPSLGIFAPLFDGWVTMLIGIVWFGSIIYAVVMLIISITKMLRARKNFSGYGMHDAILDMILPVVVLIMLSSIVAIILVL